MMDNLDDIMINDLRRGVILKHQKELICEHIKCSKRCKYYSDCDGHPLTAKDKATIHYLTENRSTRIPRWRLIIKIYKKYYIERSRICQKCNQVGCSVTCRGHESINPNCKQYKHPSLCEKGIVTDYRGNKVEVYIDNNANTDGKVLVWDDKGRKGWIEREKIEECK